MLDENLPAFILKPSGDGIPQHRDIFLTYQGNDPAPNYVLHYADPASTIAAYKNCYAAAIFDSFNADVLYGEVLARPGWTQPSLSADELRRNGGIPPPPQPIIPSDFTIQLYNPDQQIKVQINPGKLGRSDSYEFSMPQETFREPSASNIDRGRSDPASLATTPKIHFVWRRESRLSKDLTCFMTGRSTDVFDPRKARKDPDIAVALWRSMRELTVYEPNMQRMELEDPKGMEVVLLLSAIVIKDLFFAGKDALRELFNVQDNAALERKLSGGGLKLAEPLNHSTAPQGGGPYHGAAAAAAPPMPPRTGAPSGGARHGMPPPTHITPPPSTHARPPPMADPRSKWELDAETARLRAQADAEARALQQQRQAAERAAEAESQRIRRALEAERAARERAVEEETRRLRRQVEQEEKEARRRQAAIDKETERLRKQYGVQEVPGQQGQQQRPQANMGQARHSMQGGGGRLGDNGLYVAPSRPSSVMMSGAAGSSGAGLGVPSLKPAKKKSFFGLRGLSDEAAPQPDQRNRLTKKSSTLW